MEDSSAPPGGYRRSARIWAMGIVVALLVLVIIAVAYIFLYNNLGFSAPTTWVNPMAPTSGASTATPAWSCDRAGQGLVFRKAVFSVVDAAGVSHSLDVSATLSALEMPSNSTTINLNAPLSSFSFKFASFTPLPPVIVSYADIVDSTGAVTADSVSSALTRLSTQANGAALHSDSTSTTAAIQAAGFTTYGAPTANADGTGGNIIQYSIEDVTATLVETHKCR